jgi:hypothetical protein
MMAYHCRYAFALSLVFVIGGCVHQSTIPIPSKTINSATSTPDSNALDTDTPHPENTPTIIPTSYVTQTSPPEPTLVSGWFPIPNLTHPDTIDFSTARSFKGLKIPPLPDELVIEFYTSQPMEKYHLKPSFINYFSYAKETQECFGLEFLSMGQRGVVGRKPRIVFMTQSLFQQSKQIVY